MYTVTYSLLTSDTHAGTPPHKKTPKQNRKKQKEKTDISTKNVFHSTGENHLP